MSFIFYSCVEIIAISFLICADNMVSERRRKFIQTDSRFFLLNRNFILYAHHLCFMLSFLVLFLVAALRDNVGIDYHSYADAYLTINFHPESVNTAWLEPSYIFICRMLGIFAPRNYYIMFAFISFLTMLFLYGSIYKISCSWAMSLYIFICFCLYYQSFNQIRQILAITVTTYACWFLIQDRVKTFFFYVFVAYLLHKSAMVMLLLGFVYKRDINIKNLCMYILICILLHFGYSVIINTLLPFTKYSGYIGSSFDMYMKLSTVINMAVRIIMLAGCLMFSKGTIKRAPYTVTFYNSVIICTILQTLTLRSAIFGRTTTYFFVVYIFLIPEVVKTIESYFTKKGAKLIRLTAILFLMIYYLIYCFAPGSVGGSGGIPEYKMLYFS